MVFMKTLYKIIDNEGQGFLEDWEPQTKKTWLIIINEMRYNSDESKISSLKQVCEIMNLTIKKA